MIISISPKLADKENIKLDDSCGEVSELHIDTFVAADCKFIIVIARGSYFSHIFDVDDNETFEAVLQEMLPEGNKFIKMDNPSICSRLSSITEKAKLIIESNTAEENMIDVQKAVDTLNNISWEFLDNKTPTEIRDTYN